MHQPRAWSAETRRDERHPYGVDVESKPFSGAARQQLLERHDLRFDNAKAGRCTAKKGNEWHFGMKLHIGVDADSGLVHSMRATAANVADVTEAHRLLHGEEREAYGDAGYRGVEKRPEQAGSEVEWRVAMRPGLRRLLEPGSEAARAEREKASLRAQVEHPFLAVKRRFGYDKVRYRGLAKNRERLALLLGLTNLLRAEPQLA